MTIILTACTQRKRVVSDALLCARDLPSGDLCNVVEVWQSRVRRVNATQRAQDLYCGRSFGEAVTAARLAQAELYIVSAGLGLVHVGDEVPPYNLTVSKGSPDCVMSKLNQNCSDADWWTALGGSDALIDVVRGAPQLVIIGLPLPYLRMIAPTLALLSDKLFEKIRIVGGRDVANLDPRLETYRLPYDDRLDGPESPVRGTKSDFASRATRHFAGEVLVKFPMAPIDFQRTQLTTLMSAWTRPITKTGRRLSDPDLRSIVRDNWSRVNGHTTKLLRILRDEMNVACEQKRFARLAAEIREERML